MLHVRERSFILATGYQRRVLLELLVLLVLLELLELYCGFESAKFSQPFLYHEWFASFRRTS